MHIAFWSPAWPLEKFHNGIVTFVHWMRREFQNQGHRVSVFTSQLEQAEADPGVYCVRRPIWDRLTRRLGRRWLPIEQEIFDFSKVIAAEILRVHRRDPIDILEMEESFGWFDEVARRTALPTLVKLHGPAFLSMVDDELDSPFGRAKIEREGQALARAPVITAPSPRILAQTIERYRLTPREQGHIVNPLPAESGAPVWRLDACDRNTILFVGRFDLRKGADVMLKAFSSLSSRYPSLKLIFVGPDRGWRAQDGGWTHFAQYCEAMFPADVRARIDYRGAMANRDIWKLRTDAMVTVVASRWENQGYSVLEAMLQGCPLVCTDAGGCPESVIDGVTGRLARSEDPEDFAAKLAAVLEDPLGARTMGLAARRYVLEQHSTAAVAAASFEMYNRIISSARSIKTPY